MVGSVDRIKKIPDVVMSVATSVFQRRRCAWSELSVARARAPRKNRFLSSRRRASRRVAGTVTPCRPQDGNKGRLAMKLEEYSVFNRAVTKLPPNRLEYDYTRKEATCSGIEE